jgi:predicted Zn-dependent peptidase
MAKVPAKHLRQAVAVLSDMLLHSAFRPRDIEKEREVILEEIRMVEDSPAQYVHELFNQLLWPNHPLGNLLSGTAETVTRITRRDLLGFWRRFYHPRNLVASCAGAFDAEALTAQLRRLFGRPRAGSPKRFRAAPRLQPGPQIRLLHKTTEQTHLCLGTPAVPRTHPQRFALELLHVLLGANMSSRLFREVREKRALVYEIGTQVRRYYDTGAFVIYAGCDAAKLRTTVRTVIAELARIKREPVQPQELRRAKDFYEGQLLMGLEDTMEHMLWIGEQTVTVGRASDARSVIQGLAKVTAEQVREAARRLFSGRRTFLAVIGPAPQQEAEALRGLCQL